MKRKLAITLAMLAVAKVEDEQDVLLQAGRHALDRESECKLNWVDPQDEMSADQLRHRVEELCSDPHWAVANADTCRSVLDELFETRSRNDMCEELNKARELWLQHGHDKGTLPEASVQPHIDHSALIAHRLAARGMGPAAQLAPNADDAHIALDQFDGMCADKSCKLNTAPPAPRPVPTPPPPTPRPVSTPQTPPPSYGWSPPKGSYRRGMVSYRVLDRKGVCADDKFILFEQECYDAVKSLYPGERISEYSVSSSIQNLGSPFYPSGCSTKFENRWDHQNVQTAYWNVQTDIDQQFRMSTIAICKQ